jgi:type IV pilus assembly protein PilB
VASLSPIKLTGFSRRLVENGLLSEEVAVEALSKSRQENVSLVSHLVKRKLASSLDIAIAASEEFGTPLLDLDSFDGRPRVIEAHQRCQAGPPSHRVLPLYRRGKRLFLARLGPDRDACAIDEITFAHRHHRRGDAWSRTTSSRRASTRPYIDAGRPALDRSATSTTRTASTSRSLEVSGGDERARRERQFSDVDDAPIVRFVNKVLLDAIRRGASDIHFEPYEKIYRVRLRIDGMLKEIASRRCSSQ